MFTLNSSCLLTCLVINLRGRTNFSQEPMRAVRSLIKLEFNWIKFRKGFFFSFSFKNRRQYESFPQGVMKYSKSYYSGKLLSHPGLKGKGRKSYQNPARAGDIAEGLPGRSSGQEQKTQSLPNPRWSDEEDEERNTPIFLSFALDHLLVTSLTDPARIHRPGRPIVPAVGINLLESTVQDREWSEGQAGYHKHGASTSLFFLSPVLGTVLVT